MGVDRPYYVSFFFFFFFNIYPSFVPFFHGEALASLPSFSRYAKVSSPFLQLAMCPFSESSKKPEEQHEEVSP